MNPAESSQDPISAESGPLEKTRSVAPLHFSRLSLKAAGPDGRHHQQTPPSALLPTTLLSYLKPLTTETGSCIARGAFKVARIKIT